MIRDSVSIRGPLSATSTENRAAVNDPPRAGRFRRVLVQQPGQGIVQVAASRSLAHGSSRVPSSTISEHLHTWQVLFDELCVVLVTAGSVRAAPHRRLDASIDALANRLNLQAVGDVEVDEV